MGFFQRKKESSSKATPAKTEVIALSQSTQPEPARPEPARLAPAKANKPKLIVGIDFGTTYSGICFALSNATELEQIKAWTKYPGSAAYNGEYFEKVPSVIAFASENEGLSVNAWGYQVEPGMKSYSGFKLFLDEAALSTEYDDPQLQESTAQAISTLPLGMSAKEVVTAYLRGLHAMFWDAVVSFLTKEISDEMPMDFWLTVPATWTETAKILSRQAAVDAGFGTRAIDRVMLISEPEAGAHLALRASIHQVHDLVNVDWESIILSY